MFTALLSDGEADARDRLMARLEEEGVETRPVFYPVHSLPPYREAARRERDVRRAVPPGVVGTAVDERAAHRPDAREVFGRDAVPADDAANPAHAL